MSIKKAQEVLRAKREAGDIEIIDPLEKAARNPKSLRSAITAMCWECVGRNNDTGARREVAMCTSWDCPLWELRPWRNTAPAGYGAEKRLAAITCSLQVRNSSIAAAYRAPSSRRKGIRAKCAQCMGGNRKSITDCQSTFPREKFGLDTPTGYRGCPLWPVRLG